MCTIDWLWSMIVDGTLVWIQCILAVICKAQILARQLALSCFSLVFSPLPPQTKQFWGVTLAFWQWSEQQKLLCLWPVSTNLWKWHMGWEILFRSKKLGTSSGFSSGPCCWWHSGSTMVCENIWEKKRAQKKCVFVCVQL